MAQALIKFLVSLTLVLAISLSLFAQSKVNGSVKGVVVDQKSKQALEYASVAVKTVKDSVVVGSGVTLAKGDFEIKGLQAGNYKLYIAFLGMKTTVKEFSITAAAPVANLGTIEMLDGTNLLKGVVIKGEAPPVTMKKDTIEFNASSFKVRENSVVEDVLKKLPGVEVAKDGTVKAQGEQVTKVTVDGKQFFGSDPTLATKNLPADMIDKIQVIDQLSDQSRFTGVDDGNREKVINITTKQDKKFGYFGNASAGYGTDDRYDGSLNVNSFNGNRQLSLLSQFNNVNKQGFSVSDVSGFAGGTSRVFGGGGGGRGGSGGSGAASLIDFGGKKSGVATISSGGLNYNDNWDENTEVNASYFFNKIRTINDQSTSTLNLFPGNNFTNNQDQSNVSDRMNQRLNFTIDHKIDSLTSLKVSPSINYTDNKNNGGATYNSVYGDAAKNTVGSQTLNSDNIAPTFANTLLLRRKFMKRGRTISLSMNSTINDGDGTSYNTQDDHFTNGQMIKNLNQYNTQQNSSINNTVKVAYTEPLSRKLTLELNYTNGYFSNKAEKLTYDFDPATGQYDKLSKLYSNEYGNQTYTNQVGFNLAGNSKKYNYTIGFGLQQTNMSGQLISKDSTYHQQYLNYIPTASFTYNFSRSKRLRVNYRGVTNQPSISQLQPVPDLTDPLFLRLGNPNLKAEFANTLRISYNNFDFNTYRTFLIFTTIGMTSNKIANSNVFDPAIGKTVIKPVNVDGAFNFNTNISLGIPIIKQKLTMNNNTGIGFVRDISLANNVRNVTSTWNINHGYDFNFTLDTKFDFSLGLKAYYNRVENSTAAQATTNYFTYNGSFNISYMFPWKLRLGSDIDYYKNTGRGAGFNTSYALMNAFISKQMFKNDAGTIKLAVNDILKQNVGIDRTITDNSIQDSRYNVLQRYFMLSFSYKFNRFAGKNLAPQQDTPGMPGMRFRRN